VQRSCSCLAQLVTARGQRPGEVGQTVYAGSKLQGWGRQPAWGQRKEQLQMAATLAEALDTLVVRAKPAALQVLLEGVEDCG